MKAYSFANTKNIEESERQKWVPGLCIAEDGRCEVGHLHSSLAFCRHDLSLDGLRGGDIRKAYGDDVEVEFVNPDDVTTHAGLQAAFKKAEELAAIAKTTEKPQ